MSEMVLTIEFHFKKSGWEHFVFTWNLLSDFQLVQLPNYKAEVII